MVALPFTWMRLDSGESEVLLVSPFGHSPPKFPAALADAIGSIRREDRHRGR